MATKHRPGTAAQRRRANERAVKPGSAKDAALLNAEDKAVVVPADRVATADEVRSAGERAAARWGSLLKRLAE